MTARAPPFFFQINKMRQDPRKASRRTIGNFWVPPRAHGYNQLVGGDTTGQYFFFDGMATRPMRGLPPGLAHFRTCSMYYDDSTTGFWVIDYSALQSAVGDGSQDNLPQRPDELESEDEDEDEDDWRMDWHQLGFVNGEGDYANDYTSYVTCASSAQRLFLQKETQQWARKLFPERYHALPQYTIAANHPNQHSDWGGLIGDLSLILALIAFSAREDEVAQAVQHCVHGSNRWRMHGMPRRRGWRNRRGVVVTIWSWPGAAGLDARYRSTNDDLQEFEEGDYGKIYD
ncbi:hypothetical protein EV356DRAFT_238550 [Viridothelium virens]|uniref:Uncharacterized protein n=1 Tax=Viridothelium virens TaxID=1048519 RepID=A0A6A6H420_VIRVR|nr:hypothetical protein EV356DRAFT_238550 [Viridothelium virens]